MKTKPIDDKAYKKAFREIEDLYLKEDYEEIVRIVNTNSETLFYNTSKEHFCEFSEAISVSNIALGNLNEALVIINRYLSYLETQKEFDEDDLDTFYQLKIDVYGFKNQFLKQMYSVEDYIESGGKKSEILSIQKSVEDLFFSKYFKMNQILLYAAIGLILFSLLWKHFQGGLVLTTLTTIIIAWCTLNYFFQSEIKRYVILLAYSIRIKRKISK